MNSVLYSALQSRGIPSPKEEVAPQALLLLKPPQRYKHVSHTFVKVAKTLVSKQKTDPTSRWESEKPTDFNDLFILEGVEKVREIFEKSQQENAVCDCELDGFRLTEDKLFYYDERRKVYVFVSGYVKVIAQTGFYFFSFSKKLNT